MAKIAEVQEVAVNELKPYEQNAKIHGAEQIEKLKASIEEFGFLTPCLIDREKNLIAGHGRVMAAADLGMETVPCVFIEGLTEAQRRAYILADNRLGELGEWDWPTVNEELRTLDDMDFAVELTGFDMPDAGDWFSDRTRNNKSREDENDEYNEFLDKFEPKKTTDDCYTPDIVYDAIANWVAEEYGLKREDFVRPFYPGGDYQKYKYPSGGVVVDNPPFSILSEILRWYDEHGVRFFLFAPTMTLFSSSSSSLTACALPCGGKITYENGAVVATSFVTNLEDNRVRVIPELYKVVEAADAENQSQFRKTLPKYKYPDEVLTAAMCRYMCEHDTALTIRREDSYHIRQLESQKEYNDSAIFGSGYLLSEKAAAEKAAAEKAAAEKAAAEKAAAEKAAAEKAAAEKAAAEKAAAEKAAAEKAAAHIWELSEKEKEIVRSLGHQEKERNDG